MLLVSTDVRRPAAILQLERLAEQRRRRFLPEREPASTPAAIARAALEAARRGVYDTLIIDTAGRLHIDAELMQEVQAIDAAVGPHQRLFVVDAMAGQDALNAARAFGAALELTGIILTKADGDARGGAALSVRYVTGKPIVFLGVGEKTRGAAALRSRAHGLAHPRHGRCGLAGRGGAAQGRCRRGREAGAQGGPGQGFSLLTCAPARAGAQARRAWAR